MVALLATMLWMSELTAFNPPSPRLDGQLSVWESEPSPVYDNPLFLKNNETWLFAYVSGEDTTLRLEADDHLDELAAMARIHYLTLPVDTKFYVGTYTYEPLQDMTPYESAQISLLFTVLMNSQYPYTDESVDNWIKHHKLERHFK